MSVILCAVLLAAAPSAPAPKYELGRKAILRLVEASPKKYLVAAMPEFTPQWHEQNLAALYPLVVKGLRSPVAVIVKGERQLVEAPQDPELMKALASIFEQTQAKNFLGAQQTAAKATKKFPKDSRVQVLGAEAFNAAGDPKTAAEWFTRARQLNPEDHMAWFGEGMMALKLGKADLAGSLFVRALATRPRHPLFGALDPSQFGRALEKTRFDFRASIKKVGDTILMQSDKGAHWATWAACKAVWRGDDARRQVVIGSRSYTLSVTEEQECLLVLLEEYALQRAEEKTPRDPMLERMTTIAKAGMLFAFATYELLSRADPHVVQRLDEAGQTRLEQYVDRFVLAKSP